MKKNYTSPNAENIQVSKDDIMGVSTNDEKTAGSGTDVDWDNWND